MKIRFGLLTIALVSQFATAQLAIADDTTATTTVAPSISAPLSSEVSSQWSAVGGIKSFNDTGRNSDGTGRQLKSKNEYYLGAKNKAGWGAYAMFVAQATQFSDSAKNRFSPSDPSISILHPIYSNGDTKVSGQFKEYFPVSDFSQNRTLYEQTYYLTATTKLNGGLDLFNQWIPRYFSQAKYAPTDTTFYMEDYTGVSKTLSDSVRVGVGQHAQWEWHNRTDAGSTIEVYPYADFMLTKTIFAGPRLYMPVWVQNAVYDAPKAVSTTNFQGEIYIQATL